MMIQRHQLLVAPVVWILGSAVRAQTPSALPVDVRIAVHPTAFRGSDAKAHLAYEASITNVDRKGRKLTLTRIEVLDGVGQTTPRASFSGAELSGMLLRPGLPKSDADTRVIGGGMIAVAWLWLTLDEGPVPDAIRHRLTFTIEGVAQEQVVELAATRLSQKPLAVLPAPIHGANWWAANGPSNTSEHRQALMAINGQLLDGQRFAIDWVQFGEDGKLARNSGAKNSDFYDYGQELFAVADGKVADTRDSIPENTPGSLAVPIDLGTIAGNYVVLDLGSGLFAGYAHLQPGSLRVRKGDRVHRGDVIGLLGNSGNSDAPHLHYQLMDAPSILGSEGVPFLLERFTIVGTSGEDAVFHRLKSPAVHARELPLENTVVSLP
jgi:hypothetical protein